MGGGGGGSGGGGGGGAHGQSSILSPYFARSTAQRSPEERAAMVRAAKERQQAQRAARAAAKPNTAKVPKVEQTPEEMRAGARARMNLHNARQAQYKREDIISRDYVIKSFHEFSYHARTAAHANDVELLHALGINRQGRRIWRGQITANPNSVAYKAAMAQRHDAYKRYQQAHSSSDNTTQG